MDHFSDQTESCPIASMFTDDVYIMEYVCVNTKRDKRKEINSAMIAAKLRKCKQNETAILGWC